MCGIAGLINFDGRPVSPEILKKMTDEIYHRGPDGEGHWVKDNVAIGHRRLSIIDLTNAGYTDQAIGLKIRQIFGKENEDKVLTMLGLK